MPDGEVNNPPQSTNPAPTPPPEPRPPVVVNQQPSTMFTDALSGLQQTLAAMPEKIVNGLREATPAPPQQPSAPQQQQQSAQAAQQPAQQPPQQPQQLTRKQRFHKAWFGDGS